MRKSIVDGKVSEEGEKGWSQEHKWVKNIRSLRQRVTIVIGTRSTYMWRVNSKLEKADGSDHIYVRK